MDINKRNTITIVAPMTGEIIGLEEVEDKVFSEKMMGDGFAISPTNGTLVSPCDGKVILIFPTSHAIGIETPEGLELLIHIGLDTVHLQGKGFISYVKPDEMIKKGQKLIKVDLDFVGEHSKSLKTPVIITNMEMVERISVHKGSVKKGKDIAMEIEIKS